MNKRRKHLYHLVNRSSRAFCISVTSFFFMTGFAYSLANVTPKWFTGDLLFISFLLLIPNLKKWHDEIISESTHSGFHTIIVQLGLKLGFILFIVSEIMLFFGFFWAFLHVSISPSFVLGLVWPPKAIPIIDPLGIPFFNTLVLLLSGFSLTWVHQALVNRLLFDAICGWLLTIALGNFFLYMQVMEYYEAPFNFNDGVYGCTFYMLTGLHGIHVFIGVNFITICFFRYLRKHFTPSHHLGFLFAAWYWHFVDIVWVLLFVLVYIWGSGLGTAGNDLAGLFEEIYPKKYQDYYDVGEIYKVIQLFKDVKR